MDLPPLIAAEARAGRTVLPQPWRQVRPSRRARSSRTTDGREAAC